MLCAGSVTAWYRVLIGSNVWAEMVAVGCLSRTSCRCLAEHFRSIRRPLTHPSFPTSSPQHTMLLGAPMSYEYLSRELLWHGFSEFAVFVLPYLDFRWLIAKAMRRLRTTQLASKTVGDSSRGGDVISDGKETDGAAAAAAAAPTVESCAICNQSPPWSAHKNKCGHTFCYYCASTAALQSTSAECPVCYEVLTIAGLSRVGADIT